MLAGCGLTCCQRADLQDVLRRERQPFDDPHPEARLQQAVLEAADIHPLVHQGAVDAGGGDVQRLTDDPAKDWGSTWSPDGTQIAFASERDGNWEIYTMNADGSQKQRITNHEAKDMDPDWRPDWINR